jgi:hypothetical protein
VLLLPILLATLAFDALATGHCVFDSGEVRTRRGTRASEEDGRRWVVYLKRLRDDPSAPVRTANSRKDFNSHVDFQEKEQVTDTNWRNTAPGRSNTNHLGALLPSIASGYYFETIQHT